MCRRATSVAACLDIARRIVACIHLLPSHVIHSVFLVLLITALQPMYLSPPTNTPEVIRAIGNSKKLIHVFVAAAVVIAVVTLAAALGNTYPNYRTVDLLIKPTAPVIISVQHSLDIVSAYQNTLHAPIDAISVASAQPLPNHTRKRQVCATYRLLSSERH